MTTLVPELAAESIRVLEAGLDRTESAEEGPISAEGAAALLDLVRGAILSSCDVWARVRKEIGAGMGGRQAKALTQSMLGLLRRAPKLLERAERLVQDGA